MAANIEDYKSEYPIVRIRPEPSSLRFSTYASAHFVRYSAPPLPLTSPSLSPILTTPETLQDRDTHIRESWVKAMEARIVRDELVKCQRGEGVNHYKNCQHLAEMYTGMIRENKVGLKLI